MTNSIVEYALSHGGELTDIGEKCNNVFGRILTNPSCVVYKGKLVINCRAVDYIKTFKNDDFNLCLSNMNQDYSSCSTITSQNVVVNIENGKGTLVGIPSGFEERYSGLEDGRLIVWGDRLYIYGTRWDVVEGKGVICLYELDDNYNVIDSKIINSPFNTQCEKNWCGIEDKLFQFMYKTEPQTIIQPIFHFNTTHFISKEKRTSGLLDGARGNSNIVRFDKEHYIQLVHNSVYTYRQNITELHYKFRFVVYDNNFNVTDISNEFNFMHDLCEFSCGMCFDGDTAYITFSEIDASAYLLKMPKTGLIDFINDKGTHCAFDWEKHYYDKATSFLRKGNVKNAIPFYCVSDSRGNHCFEYLMVMCYYTTQVNYDTNRLIEILTNLYNEYKMPEYLLLLAIVYKRNNEVIKYEECKKKGLESIDNIQPEFLRFVDLKSI